MIRILFLIAMTILMALTGCGDKEVDETAKDPAPKTDNGTETRPTVLASEVLPRTEELTGYEQVASPSIIKESDLADFIGPDMPIFERFGVLEAASADYASVETNRQFVIDAYTFPSLSLAFGLYAEVSSSSHDYVSVGSEGFIDNGSLIFFKDRYVVRVTGYEDAADGDSALVSLARVAAMQIEADAVFPAAVEIMPEDGRIPHSCAYYPDSFMGYDFFSPVYSCDYKLADSVSTLFFAPRGTEAELILYSNRLKERNQTVFEGTEGDLKLYFADDEAYGRVIMSAKIGRIAGVLNTPDREHGMDLLNALWGHPELQ